ATTGRAPVCAANLCDDLAAWCDDLGLGGEACAKLGLICPGNPCAACDGAAAMCGGACGNLGAVCNESLAACDCDYACDAPTNELTMDEIFALCITHPWPLGDDCVDASTST